MPSTLSTCLATPAHDSRTQRQIHRIMDAIGWYADACNLSLRCHIAAQSLSLFLVSPSAPHDTIHIHLCSATDTTLPLQNVTLYYAPKLAHSKTVALHLVARYRDVFTEPMAIHALPTTHDTSFCSIPPSIFLALDATHLAQWSNKTADAFARATVCAFTQHCACPFRALPRPRLATVETPRAAILKQPCCNAALLSISTNGEQLLIQGKTKEWYLVKKHKLEGYINSAHITIHY